MSILTILYVSAAVLLLFGAAVFVHEWGHFYVALRRGMKVEAFAIGFGPKLFSWTKNGIEYSWRLIPAGGFVKLPQMVTSEAIEGAADKSEPIPPASPLSKILVAVAGPFMNVVFAFLIATILYFTGLPVLVNPSVIGYVEPGSPEAVAGIKEGDKIVGVNGQEVKTWQDVATATILARTNVMPVIIERGGERKTFQLEAKQNEVLGGKFLNLDPKDHPEIQGVNSGSAAEAAGLKVKDVIINFAGVPIAGRDQLINLIQKRGGVASEIRVERGAEKLTLTVTPKQDPTTKKGLIGVALGNNSVNEYELQKPGPLPWVSVMEVVNKTLGTFSALAHPKETGVGAKDLAGPIGILAMLGSQVKADYRLALNFLILLNVNLAILNMLPLPVLDGGHVVLSILEKIRRRPIHPKVLEYVTACFAVLLLTFMAYVSFHDVKRFPLFRAMFNQENQIGPSSAKPEPTR